MEQQLFNFLMAAVVTLTTIIGTGIGWWVNNIWGMVRALQSQVVSLNVELAKNYMPRAELQLQLTHLNQKMDDVLKELRTHGR